MGQIVESVPFQLRIVVIIEVVDSIDGVALLQPVAAEVVADETGRAGDEDFGGGIECPGECHGGYIPSSLSVSVSLCRTGRGYRLCPRHRADRRSDGWRR